MPDTASEELEKKPEKKKAPKKKKKRKRERTRRFSISRDAREYLIENLSMQVNAGMDLLQALEALQKDTKSRGLKKAIKVMLEEIESGGTLSSAIHKTKIVSEQVISLIRIGEEGGRLGDNLSVVVLQQQKDREFRSRLRSAMVYPIFVLTTTVLVALGIAWFILPNLAQTFSDLSADLPLLTIILIQAGEFLADYGYIAVPAAVVGLGLFILVVFFLPGTKVIGQTLLLLMPGIRGMLIQLEIARMGYILGSLLEAGLPILDALQSLHDVSNLNVYKKFYAHIEKQIEQGYTFYQSMQSYKRSSRRIPLPIQQMISSAEQSGQLAVTLREIGTIFEKKTENATKNLSVILEPILLVVVWGGVVIVALAVILPVYGLLGEI